MNKQIYLNSKAKFDAAKVEGDQALRRLNDTDAEVRYQAAKWIARRACNASSYDDLWLENKKTTGALIKALRDTDERVVEEAAVALHHATRNYYADPRAYAAVLRLLQNKSKRWHIRNAAAHIAAWTGGEKSIPHILPLLDDGIAHVRDGALRALGDLTTSHTKPWAPDRPPLPLPGAASAEGIRQIVAAVLPLLRDKNLEVRDYTAILLGQHGDQSILEDLKQALRGERRRFERAGIKEAIEEIEKRHGIPTRPSREEGR